MIIDDVFKWASNTPDKVAIRFNGQELSFGSFANQIKRATNFLHRRGYVGPGEVLLAVSNLPHAWILSLAVRSLGYTAVPISNSKDVADIEGMDVHSVITTREESWSGLEKVCLATGVPLLYVSIEDETEISSSLSLPTPGGHVLRTSGTTGFYKKVLMDSQIEMHELKAARSLFDLNDASICLAFDFAIWTGAGYKIPTSTWSSGGTVVIRQDSPFFEALSEPSITHALVVPAMLEAILAAPEGSFPYREDLHLSITAGTITTTQREEAKRRITPNLFNNLAATEAATWAYTRIVEPQDQRWHQLVPERFVEIVDENDEPVSLGELGRLRVSTKNGVDSYFRDPAATAAFFSNGFFYPGDLALARKDGRIALQGRTTDVINLKGSKISPAPLEEKMREKHGFRELCIVSAQDSEGQERLYLVTHGDPPPAEVGDAIAKELGVGISILQIPAFPRSATGKIQRNEVRAWVQAEHPPEW